MNKPFDQLIISVEDWDLYNDVKQIMIRLGLKDPVEWLESVNDEHPTLAALYEQGKYDQYQTMLALLNLSYKEYTKQFTTLPLIRRATPQLIANSIVGVQPMSAPTGKILKSK